MLAKNKGGSTFEHTFSYFRMVLNSHSTDAENLVYFESLKRCVYLSFLKKVKKFVEFQSFDK